jgi:hypothetical protein
MPLFQGDQWIVYDDDVLRQEGYIIYKVVLQFGAFDQKKNLPVKSLQV